MFLDGFAVSGYRSFGSDLVKIRDLGKVNVFIGKNNSGKSNVLRFLQHLSHFDDEGLPAFGDGLDFHDRLESNVATYGFQIKRESERTGCVFSSLENAIPRWSEVLNSWEDEFWFVFQAGKPKAHIDHPHAKYVSKALIEHLGPDQRSNFTKAEIANSARVISQRSGGPVKELVHEIAANIGRLCDFGFQTEMIDDFRQITSTGNSSPQSGRDLISRLLKLQSPDYETRSRDKQRFRDIKGFMRSLLGRDDVDLEIPARGKEIIVSIGDQIRPLRSFGAGIHEVVIMAAAVTDADGVVFCIEEPELHLHPSLQKRFVQYLLDHTNNQYMITTHSNAFLDMPGVNVYHCQLVEDQTKCDLVRTRTEKGDVLDDLGYKASDLVQANYLIWVEGPSDRIYLRHWIEAVNPGLIEGIHFSVMFYGGRLLSHLSYDDNEVNEFIDLGRLNRNVCIVIDSDRKTGGAHLNDTKLRVRKEFEDNHQLVWVTQGREIENYLPEELLNKAVKSVHRTVEDRIEWSQYSNLTKPPELKSGIDKVAVAREISSHKADFSKLDLQRQVSKLVADIRKANA